MPTAQAAPDSDRWRLKAQLAVTFVCKPFIILCAPLCLGCGRNHAPLLCGQFLGGRGAARESCHAAVRRNLGIPDAFSQIRSAYHAVAADVRPRLPLMCAQIELDARYLCVQERRSDLATCNLQVVRKSAFFAIHASADF